MVKEVIRKSNGKFMSVTFKRLTNSKTSSARAGDVETRVFRTGVSKGVKGVGLKFSPEEKGLVTLWSVTDGGYRMVNVDSVLSIKCGGILFNK